MTKASRRLAAILNALPGCKYPTIHEHGGGGTPYMTRICIGRLRYHVFWRGDLDPEPHDHPFAFVTFPLTPYVEDVYDPYRATWKRRVVGAFRFHYRRADHTHRVLGRHDLMTDDDIMPGKIRTIVIRGAMTRKWGFWCKRVWVYWRDYYGNGGC